jgi:hypothetical protein
MPHGNIEACCALIAETPVRVSVLGSDGTRGLDATRYVTAPFSQSSAELIHSESSK